MKKNCFLKRRDALIQMMSNQDIVVLPAAQDSDSHYLYRQDSDFYYLTGFEEPESIAVIYKDMTGISQFVLLSRPENQDAAIWTGKLAGQVGACTDYGADEAYDIAKTEEILLRLFEGKEQIYYPIGRYAAFDHQMMKLFKKMESQRKRGGIFPQGWTNSNALLHELRVVKDDQEIQWLRKSAHIAALAHRKVMEICQPGMYEYELKACLVSEFLRMGATEEAYPSIVAGGQNGCILHYQENSEVLKRGDLVLIDAGARYHYYTSDITRTFPTNKQFTKPQASIYQLVLEAQLAVISYIKPGILFSELQEVAVAVLTEGLIGLHLLKGSLTHCLETKAYSRFFMHGVSHWLGIDLHDVGYYRRGADPRVLKPGMVLTVEPGLYLSDIHSDLSPEWRNIAVRIEDDVLVTDHGCEVLSQEAPKSLKEIEALR